MSNNKEFDNELRGSIFKNHDKEKLKKEKDTSNWAEYQGKIQVAGVEFYISLWIKEITKGEMKGQKFFSTALKPVDENEYNALRNGNNVQSSSGSSNLPDDDDDLPF